MKLLPLLIFTFLLCSCIASTKPGTDNLTHNKNSNSLYVETEAGV